MGSERRSLLSVFDTVAACTEISRAQLSEITGFSQVTVGKAVDQLDSAGVLVQYKQSRGSVGRKTGICRINRDLGMLLFELSEGKTRIRVCDASFEVREDHITSEALGDCFISGFSMLVEHFGDGIMGIGFVVPDGSAEDWHTVICDALGQEPELTVTEGRAFSAANAFRFDINGPALFLRIGFGGAITGAVMNGYSIYKGAHGRAGDFSYISPSVDGLCDRLVEMCAVLDPSLIHIACEDEGMCDNILRTVSDGLSRLYNGGDAPDVVAEPVSACRDPLEGAGRLLRESYILSKLENNS